MAAAKTVTQLGKPRAAAVIHRIGQYPAASRVSLGGQVFMARLRLTDHCLLFAA